MLLPNLSDTAATSQDGSSLEFIAAIAGRQCYIQDASGRGLCPPPAPQAPSFGHYPTVPYLERDLDPLKFAYINPEAVNILCFVCPKF